MSVFCPQTVSEKPPKATKENKENPQVTWVFCIQAAVSDAPKYPHNPKVGI
jgi:hypothetical protein